MVLAYLLCRRAQQDNSSIFAILLHALRERFALPSGTKPWMDVKFQDMSNVV